MNENESYRALPPAYSEAGYTEPYDLEEPIAGTARDLAQITETLRRRWWLVTATAVVALGAAWAMGRDDVRTYTADALLQYRESAPVVGFSFAGPDPGVGAQLEIIRSLSVLAPVVDSLGAQVSVVDRPSDRTDLLANLRVASDAPSGTYLLEHSGSEVAMTDVRTGELVTRSPEGAPVEGPGFSFGPVDPELLDEPVTIQVVRRQAAAERLQRRILVEEGTGANLVTVSYTDPDPRYAAEVVNQVAGSYMEYSKSANKSAQSRRRAAIADQMVVLADSLRAAQDQSMEYQSQAQLLDPAVEGNALMSTVLSTETELQTMRFQERLLESIVTGLQNSEGNDESLHRLMALGGELIPGAMSLESELRTLEAERSRLTASQFGLTQSNPEVVVLDSLIASTKNQMQITAEQALALHRAKIEDTQERLYSVRAQLSNLPARTAEFTRLEQRVEAIQESFDLLVAQYFQAQIEEGAEAGDVQVVDPAHEPLWPDPDRRLLKYAVALMAGLLIGGLGALTLDQLDSRVRGPRDAERAVHLQVLGTVPKISSRSSNPKSVLIGKEAFRGLRTNIRFALEEAPRLMAITSSAPGEGKSTIAVNLALTLAEQGVKVLLIDADLRRPQVHRILGVERVPGLADVLMGQAEVEHAIVPSPVHPGLSVLPGGSATGSPAELVGGDAFMSLVLGLRDHYDTVLVDTSPVLAVTDAALIGTVADGTLVVVRANETDQGALSQAVEQLRRVNANLVGIVLNDVPLDNVGYSSYYDSYYDGEGEDTRHRHLLQSGTGSS